MPAINLHDLASEIETSRGWNIRLNDAVMASLGVERGVDNAWNWPGHRERIHGVYPCLISSLNAFYDMHRKLAPDWRVTLTFTGTKATATVETDTSTGVASASEPAHALLAAFLRARADLCGE